MLLIPISIGTAIPLKILPRKLLLLDLELLLLFPFVKVSMEVSVSVCVSVPVSVRVCVCVCVSVSVLLWMLAVAFVTEFLEIFAEVLTNAFFEALVEILALFSDCFALLLIKLFNNLNPGIKPKRSKKLYSGKTIRLHLSWAACFTKS